MYTDIVLKEILKKPMASVLVQPVYIFALKIEAHKINIFVKYYKVNLSFNILKPILSNRNVF